MKLAGKMANTRSMDSGSAHVRYGHDCRPKKLHLSCPKCGSLADAEKPSEKKMQPLIGDLSPSWCIDDWQIVCRSCFYRKEQLGNHDLPGLFYSDDQTDIWSWNKDHLLCILACLKGENLPFREYDWLMTYVRGTWKGNRQSSIRKIEALLSKPTNAK